MADVKLSLSGIELTLENLPGTFEEKITEEWAPFLAQEARDPVLSARVEVDDPAEATAPFAPLTMTLRVEDGAGEFDLPGGHAWLRQDGSVRIRLDDAGRESYFNMVNLLLACLAARLPARGAALVHAGCLLVEGRAYLLVGSEGAGKSTWTRLGQDAGATAVSDDLVLVDGSFALGSPFRSRHLPGEATPGRWPIAALLFPRHGSAAARRPANRLLAMAHLTANLPFISAMEHQDPHAAAFIDRLLTDVPGYDLTFTLDPSFLPLLD